MFTSVTETTFINIRPKRMGTGVEVTVPLNVMLFFGKSGLFILGIVTNGETASCEVKTGTMHVLCIFFLCLFLPGKTLFSRIFLSFLLFFHFLLL